MPEVHQSPEIHQRLFMRWVYGETYHRDYARILELQRFAARLKPEEVVADDDAEVLIVDGRIVIASERR